MPPDEPTGAGHARSCGADDAWVHAWLASALRRWRQEASAYAAILAAIAALIAAGVGASFLGIVLAGALGLCAALWRVPFALDARRLVAATERGTPQLQNALRAWHEASPESSPRIRRHLAAQVHAALGPGPPPRVTTRADWVVVGVLACLGAALLVVPASTPEKAAPFERRTAADQTSGPAQLSWTITATPPAYTGRPASRVMNPSQVVVLDGTTVAIDVRNLPLDATLRVGATMLPITRGSDRLAHARLVARQSEVVLLQGAGGQVLGSMALVVQPDAPPRLRIIAPARDLRQDASTGRVAIQVVADDDLGLRDLRLRFTRVSGSGESFTFEDGEWPLAVTRRSAASWSGAYTLDLARLALGPGDSVVYHAVAHDARPGPEGAAESERFLVEIARPGAQAAGDFSLPDPEDKFALSQRMVIQLTERLLERRARMRAEEYREQAQALAVAQRRVRAEFVFMLGGEVEDEMEEAAHSHEVEAGRLDNRGQSDLTEAVRQMSQAERRLTDADLREALPYEYKALAALQAAFGKARYFMRTLPTPVQLDETRRLTGSLDGVTAAAWALTPLREGTRAASLQVLGRLEGGSGDVSADLLAAVVALDARRGGWVGQVQDARARDGRAGLARLVRARLAASAPLWLPLPLARTPDEALAARPK